MKLCENSKCISWDGMYRRHFATNKVTTHVGVTEVCNNCILGVIDPFDLDSYTIESTAKENVPDHISVSKIRLWQQCPWKYTHAYINPEKHTRSEAAIQRYGTYLHEVLEIYGRQVLLLKSTCGNWKDHDIIKNSFEALEKLWMYVWTKNKKDDPTDLPYSFWENGIKAIRYIAKHIDRFIRVHSVEEQFFFDLHNLPGIFGFIDRVDIWDDGNKLEITDYKMGKPKKAVWVKKDIQLQVYTKVQSDLHDIPIEDITATLEFPTHHQRVSVRFTEDQIEQTLRVIESIADKILAARKMYEDSNGKDYPRTIKGPLCDYCEHLTDICPAWNKKPKKRKYEQPKLF